jgi:hypothetical protein
MYLYLARYSCIKRECCTVLLNLEIESTSSADTDINTAVAQRNARRVTQIRNLEFE